MHTLEFALLGVLFIHNPPLISPLLAPLEPLLKVIVPQTRLQVLDLLGQRILARAYVVVERLTVEPELTLDGIAGTPVDLGAEGVPDGVVDGKSEREEGEHDEREGDGRGRAGTGGLAGAGGGGLAGHDDVLMAARKLEIMGIGRIGSVMYR